MRLLFMLLCLQFSFVETAMVIAADLPPAAKISINFETHIEPILVSKCRDCHGELTQESEFRLDRKTSLIRGGDSGEPAIIPGNSADSHLIKLVAGLEQGLLMPPAADEQLSAEEIGLLRAWIDQGAPWPGPHGVVTEESLTSDHWSFQPLEEVVVPALKHTWIQNPIDAFVLSKLQEKQISPSPPAHRRQLIRRLYLDVLGLPPTPDIVEKFVNNSSDGAIHELIENVLQSPHYGERWARHWLDLVRFAETHGFETNRERPHAWRYRDYVIESLNADKPYDQFIREQIAGDTWGKTVALGYLVAGPYDLVKSPDVNLTLMQRHNELDDMINTTSTVFLGLTIGCARCHNHKFDPITQTDYYALQAIFAGVKHGDTKLPLSDDQQQRLAIVNNQINDLRQQLIPYQQRAGSRQLLILDDDPALAPSQVSHLHPIAGRGQNPPGVERGFAQDPGGPDRTQNVSNGEYSWWTNQPGKPLVAWGPQVSGSYRLWLSWGCGFQTHSEDAQYVIDRDGKVETTEDWEQVATVNQRHFADGENGLLNKPLWSGFHDAGLVSLTPQSRILLVGGKTGTAVTADAVLLEQVDSDELASDHSQPVFRTAVAATGNTDIVSPQPAKFVRFVIAATNASQPCLDELAVFAGEKNVALATNGGIATASGSLKGYPIHQLKHVNDGKFGNNFSWISDTSGTGWVQIEFPQVETIERIEWGRDRDGRYSDRLATEYRIESSLDGESWKLISSSADRLPYTASSSPAAITYRFDHLAPVEAAQARQLVDQLKQAEAEQGRLSNTPQAYAGQYSQPGPTHRLYRGEPMAKREEVTPNVPAVFAKLDLAADTPEQQRRQALAEWIASPENPLTARVIVNRIWQFHFGQGLVATPSDFGEGGVPPTNPELLDWLANELIAHDWSLKHVHRLILQSATYQQTSAPNAQALKIDGATQYWWRFPPRRLEAEPIRDSILAVSGVLDLQRGGPGFSAFEVEAENVRHYHPKKSFGPEDWRRMIYMTKVRMEQDAVFGLFDCPDAATSVPRRSTSTTPLQALNLFNSQFLLQQADLFAERLLREQPDGRQAQVQLAYQLCYARTPAAEERQLAEEFIERYGLQAFCRAVLNSNEFLFIQ